MGQPLHGLQAEAGNDRAPALGLLTGTIIDAQTREPLEGASVSIEPAPHGLMAGLETGTAGLLSVNRVTVSDDEGRYSFPKLGPGLYRVRVELLGYRSATVDVEYRGARESTVSVGLEVEPILLEAIEVEGEAVVPMKPVSWGPGAEEAVRSDAEVLRQARFLQSDVRSLTRADIGEAITLGETDLFRALQRLPGVHGRDDWSANLLTRGARWDLTRFYYDGLPLFNPLHVGGVVSGISPNAVGTLIFHPGVRPAEMGEGAAGVVEMFSRPASVSQSAGLAELSALSGRVAWEGTYDEGRSGIALSFRRTYVDWLTTSIKQSNEDNGTESDVERIPFGFQDVSFRWDQRIRSDYNLEYVRLNEKDEVRGDIPDVLHGNRGHWGNDLSRLTLEIRKRGYRVRLTKGESEYKGSLQTADPDPDIMAEYDAPTAPSAWSHVRVGLARATVEPLDGNGALPRWRGGVDLTTTEISYQGPAAVPFPGGATLGSTGHGNQVKRTSLWAERRWNPRPRVRIRAGLRTDWPEEESVVRVSPRLTAGYQLRSDIRLTAGVGRHYQYEQAVAGTGFSLGPAIEPTHIWLQHKGAVPPLVSDILNVGGEIWLGRGFLASGTAYLRWSRGHLVHAPAGGEVRAAPVLVCDELSEAWQTADGTATGLDLSLRRIFGRVTGSLAYSLSKADLTAGGITFPSPGDRRHAFDATVMGRPLGWLKLGAAFTAVSGLPYTRFVPVAGIEPEVFPTEGEVVGVAQRANAERAPALASLDLLFQWEVDSFGGRLGGYVQVKNVRNRTNAATYLGSEWSCVHGGDPSGCPGQEVLVDRFEDGIMTLPFIGFWIRF
ncbi:MAG: TonB-dependent receptor [Gemmatimonadota bacterium]|jgi:hypothetical protein